MSLTPTSHGRTTDDFQAMLLNMDFNASLGRHPKRARNGQLVDDAQPVAGAAPAAAVHDPFTGTHPADMPGAGFGDFHLPQTRQSTERGLLRSNLQPHLSVGHQSTNDLMLGAAQANGLAQPDPLRQDSGSGEPLSRDRTGWDTNTAGTVHDSKGGKKQDKTERQQMLNKAAQQRYRERKKAKANELKEAVSSLQEKVEELSKVHAEKDELQEKVGALEKELASKESHLSSLQQKEPGALVPEALPMNLTSGQSSEGGSAQCAQQYIEDVQKLKSWLGTHGYLSGGWLRSPLVLSDVPEQKQAALEKLAHDCHTSCQACLKKHGNLESAGVVDGSPNEGGPLHFQGDAAQWQQLVDQLVLDKNVKEKALELRSKYMKTLEELFQERQQLNIEAVKVLLPPEVGAMSLRSKAAMSPPLFEKLSCAFATADVLRRLRKNLAQEQKELVELEHLVYIKLLDPVQLSRCIMTAFPQHCDAVSLLNAIHAS